MLIETPGGFDYTGKDCSTWMRQAGFRKTYVEHLAGSGLHGGGNQVAMLLFKPFELVAVSQV